MIHDHPDFPSAHLPSTRTLSVYLPRCYDDDSARRYPVLYMQDGQNLFDPAKAFAGQPWHCDQIAERVTHRGLAEPFLIVGIANTPQRIQEYGFCDDDVTDPPSLAREYGRFVVAEVKPFIDAHYRTRPEAEFTGIAGSSMGGLIALQLAQWYPSTFQKCAALSPSLWWHDEAFIRSLKHETVWLQSCRIWLDMGGREGGSEADQHANLERCRRAAAILRACHADVEYHEAPDAEHHEAAWKLRFEHVLEFLFPVT